MAMTLARLLLTRNYHQDLLQAIPGAYPCLFARKTTPPQMSAHVPHEHEYKHWEWLRGPRQTQASLIGTSRKVREPAATGLIAGSSRQLENHSIRVVATRAGKLRTGR